MKMMLKLLIFIFIAIHAGLLAAGGAVPEQVHLAIGKNQNSMVVTWVSLQPSSGGPPIIKYGPSSLVNAKLGETVDFEYNGVHRYIHSVTLDDLIPATLYYYQVGSPDGMSKQYQFKSFPSPESNIPLKVCAFGDLGYLNGTSIPYLIKAAENGDFDMIIHIGDIAYDLHTDNGERGDLYMREMEPLVSRVPYMVIAGNHEDDGKNFSHYQNRFKMPGFDNQFYSFDVGPVHFVGVSTEYYGYFYEYGQGPVFNQYTWLSDDLKKADKNRANVPWIVSYQHRPFYCSNDNSYECRAFENWLVRTGYEEMPGLEELFIETKMDIGFWGHEHSYERFYPVANRTVYKDGINPYQNAAAPTYIVSGSAGCHTPKASFGEPNPASAYRSDDFGYTLMTAYNHTHINIQQISVEKNGVIDDIWLIKDKGYKMSTVNRPSISFPPALYQEKCSNRDHRCRKEFEIRKYVSQNGFA